MLEVPAVLQRLQDMDARQVQAGDLRPDGTGAGCDGEFVIAHFKLLPVVGGSERQFPVLVQGIGRMTQSQVYALLGSKDLCLAHHEIVHDPFRLRDVVRHPARRIGHV